MVFLGGGLVEEEIRMRSKMKTEPSIISAWNILGVCKFSKVTYCTPSGATLLRLNKPYATKTAFLTCDKHHHHFCIGVLLPDCTLITPAQALVLDVNSPKIGNEGLDILQGSLLLSSIDIHSVTFHK